MSRLHHVRKILSAAILLAWFSCLLNCEAKCALGTDADGDGVCDWVATGTVENADHGALVHLEFAVLITDFTDFFDPIPVVTQPLSHFSFRGFDSEFCQSRHFIDRSASPPRAPSCHA